MRVVGIERENVMTSRYLFAMRRLPTSRKSRFPKFRISLSADVLLRVAVGLKLELLVDLSTTEV